MRMNKWMKGFLTVALASLTASCAIRQPDPTVSTARDGPTQTSFQAKIVPPTLGPRRRPGGFAKTIGPLKVALITNDNGLSDKGFNHLAYLGFLRAASESKIETALAQPSTSLDYVSTIQTYASEGYNLIICVGYLMEEAVRQVAKSYPTTQFVILDDAINNLPNVTGVTFHTEQGGFLAGALAGLMEESGSHLVGMNAQNVVGVIGGFSIPPVNSYIAGFIQGVRYTDPSVTIVHRYTDSFSDPSVGWDIADEEIVSGADIIFQVASHAGLGVFQACHQSGVFAIGVDTNQAYLDPENILTSAMKGLDSAMLSVIRQAQAGQLKSGVISMSAVDGGVRLSNLLPIVPQHVVQSLNDITAKVRSGKIQVSPNLPSTAGPPKKKS